MIALKVMAGGGSRERGGLLLKDSGYQWGEKNGPRTGRWGHIFA